MEDGLKDDNLNEQVEQNAPTDPLRPAGESEQSKVWWTS